MIITKTPLRIGFFGGGTDIESFWHEEEGAVLSCTIDKYIYVIVKKSLDGRIHLKYFDCEDVGSVDEIKHDLIRECMKKAGISGGMEVAVLSDIPHTGSGLGSSSSLAVGLLNAFYKYTGKEVSKEKLARDACQIEIETLQNPIGKQDQYAAAYGGLNAISFEPDGSVRVKVIGADYDVYNEIEKRLLLFYTGSGHKAGDILKDQGRRVVNTRPVMRQMKNQVASALDIIDSGKIEAFGALMHSGWDMKKQLSNSISNDYINGLVKKAENAGASGVKITGAGGGGFLLAFCEPEKQDFVRDALGNLAEYGVRLDRSGTRVIFFENDYSTSNKDEEV